MVSSILTTIITREVSLKPPSVKPPQTRHATVDVS
jgi:hypothetical protein